MFFFSRQTEKKKRGETKRTARISSLLENIKNSSAVRFRKISSEHRRKTRKIKTDSAATAQVNKVKNEGRHRSEIAFKIKQELNESVTKMKPTQTNRRAQRGHRNHNKQLSTKFMG